MKLLTEQEKEIIHAAGTLWEMICKAIPEGPSRRANLAELVIHIHVIQVYFKANAAARAYPDEFRLLGGFLSSNL